MTDEELNERVDILVSKCEAAEKGQYNLAMICLLLGAALVFTIVLALPFSWGFGHRAAFNDICIQWCTTNSHGVQGEFLGCLSTCENKEGE